LILPNNVGRRSGIERREFSYNQHIPEQRYGEDRRSGKDRKGLLAMKVIFSILFVIVIIVTILALCVWLMLHAVKDYYPDIEDV